MNKFNEIEYIFDIIRSKAMPSIIALVFIIALAPNIANIYLDIPLRERFLVIPWVLMAYTYAICLYYEQIHGRRYVDNGLMTLKRKNYTPVLYWVFIPVFLHYYPQFIANISTSGYVSIQALYDFSTILKNWDKNNGISQILLDARFVPFGDIVIYFAYFLACYGVYSATKARIYLNGFWAVDLYEYNGEARKFVKSGPYSSTRHPIYTGQILLALGTVIIINSLVFYAYFILVVWMNYQRAKKEEQHLCREIPDYSDYIISTKMFWWLL